MTKSKFEHCRYGQSRQSWNHCDVDTIMRKWNENRPGANHLANLTDVLDYMESRKKTSNGTCNILFVGDSLSLDDLMAAQCQLEQTGYSATHCYLRGKGTKGDYGADVNVTCGQEQHDEGGSTNDFEFDLHKEISSFVLENPHATSCQKVVLMHRWPGNFGVVTKMEHLAEHRMFQNGFVMIYNWGVHCNNHNTTCLSAKLEETFLPLVTRNNKFDHWTIMLREHEPQHFSTPGGLFMGKVFNGSVTHCDRPTVKVDNWRNEELVRILKDHNLTSQQVPLVPIFKALEPMHWIHNGTDCTHYCYNPFRFDVTWDGVLNALKQHDGVPYHYIT